jgi:3-oxoacyl-[acyl-carrier protein] reductase
MFRSELFPGLGMLENKIVLVTGASRGIGQSIALAFGQAGATVAATATTQSGVSAIDQLFHQKEIKGRGFLLDVSQLDQLTEFFKQLTQSVGPPSVLINNAGITQDNLLLRMSEEAWDRVFEVNLKSVFRLTKLCLTHMIRNRFGRIINIGSVVGTIGNKGQANYAASKAALLGFTKSVAREIASRGVTANVVAPGFIKTPMTEQLTQDQKDELLKQIPVQRMGHADDVAQACVFLATASYITGHTLHVNGGLYMD